MDKAYRAAVDSLLDIAKRRGSNTDAAAPDAPVTVQDLLHLPAPVQRYLRLCGVPGKRRISHVRLLQKGQLRLKPNQAWMDFEAEQHFTLGHPGFVWGCRVLMPKIPGGLTLIRVRDSYLSGRGNMLIKLLSVFTVGNERGERMDQGSLGRYLAEIMWFPTAYVEKNLSWEPLGPDTARVTIRDCGNEASGEMHFNADGTLGRFCMERYMEKNGQFTMQKWTAVNTAPPRRMGSFLIPTDFEVTWHLDEGDFTWLRGSITHMEFEE